MTLPRVLVLTDRSHTGDRSLAEVVLGAVNAGAPAGALAVVMREKALPPAESQILAEALRPIVARAGALFIVASDPSIAADGLHLAAADPFPSPDQRPTLVGRSCHSLADVLAAEAEGCDYVTLSPVFETSSKPGYGPALGLQGLRDVVDEVGVPVFALGGIDVSIVHACTRAGAAGVAIMGEIMRAADVRTMVSAILDAIDPKLRGSSPDTEHHQNAEIAGVDG